MAAVIRSPPLLHQPHHLTHGRWSVEDQWSNFSRSGSATTARTRKKVEGMVLPLHCFIQQKPFVHQIPYFPPRVFLSYLNLVHQDVRNKFLSDLFSESNSQTLSHAQYFRQNL